MAPTLAQLDLLDPALVADSALAQDRSMVRGAAETLILMACHARRDGTGTGAGSDVLAAAGVRLLEEAREL